jgi:hypothetical protein
MEIPRATLIAHADGHILQNDKAAFVPNRFAVESALADRSLAMFA